MKRNMKGMASFGADQMREIFLQTIYLQVSDSNSNIEPSGMN